MAGFARAGAGAGACARPGAALLRPWALAAAGVFALPRATGRGAGAGA